MWTSIELWMTTHVINHKCCALCTCVRYNTNMQLQHLISQTCHFDVIIIYYRYYHILTVFEYFWVFLWQFLDLFIPVYFEFLPHFSSDITLCCNKPFPLPLSQQRFSVLLTELLFSGMHCLSFPSLPKSLAIYNHGHNCWENIYLQNCSHTTLQIIQGLLKVTKVLVP